MQRQRSFAQGELLLPASPFGKGRCHKVTEGIKRSENGAGRYLSNAFFARRKNGQTIPQSAALTAPFAQGSYGWGGLCRSLYKGAGGGLLPTTLLHKGN